MVEALGEPVYVTDEEGYYTYVNGAFAELTGCETDTLVGSHVKKVLEEDALQQSQDIIHTLLSDNNNRQQATNDLPIQTENGEERIVEDHLSLLPMDEEYQGVAGVARDITERKAREQTLERYKRLINSVPIPVFMTGAGGTIFNVNQAFADQFGTDSSEAMCQHNARELWSDSQAREALVTEVKQEGTVKRRLSKMQTLDGDSMWIAVTMTKVEHEGETILEVICHDVTDRVRREQAIEQLDESTRSFSAQRQPMRLPRLSSRLSRPPSASRRRWFDSLMMEKQCFDRSWSPARLRSCLVSGLCIPSIQAQRVKPSVPERQWFTKTCSSLMMSMCEVTQVNRCMFRLASTVYFVLVVRPPAVSNRPTVN